MRTTLVHQFRIPIILNLIVLNLRQQESEWWKSRLVLKICMRWREAVTKQIRQNS